MTDAAVKAWTDHFVEVWRIRVQEYGQGSMENILPIENQFVTHDVLEKVNTELRDRNIPIKIRCNATRREAWMVFVRVPTKEEVNRARGYLIEDGRGCCRPVLWFVYRPGTSLILDAIVLQVETDDERIRGGKIYVSFEGNCKEPFKTTIPRIVSVPHFALSTFRCEAEKVRETVFAETMYTIRVYDKFDRLSWVDVGPLASLFELKYIR